MAGLLLFYPHYTKLTFDDAHVRKKCDDVSSADFDDDIKNGTELTMIW